ncbi:MAG: diguanylate cyclase domain-containing protein [Candidatus Hydrogenedentota bacterium]
MHAPAREVSVLLIDNDAHSRATIREYLARAHFEVRTAMTGWEALKRLNDSPVDLVIASSQMENADGAPVREKFVMHPESREIPFIYLVEKDQPESTVKALRGGVDDIIERPVDPVVLVAHVQATLARREAYLRMVRVDPLTRVLNRPTFLQEMHDELTRAARYQRPGSALYLDMDDFAHINTEFGYEMGDLLLTCVAGVILTKVRNSDIAGRLAGEKFILYLPETSAEGAQRLAERIQERVAAVSDGIVGVQLGFTSVVVDVPAGGFEAKALLDQCAVTMKTAKAGQRGGIFICSGAQTEMGDARPESSA